MPDFGRDACVGVLATALFSGVIGSASAQEISLPPIAEFGQYMASKGINFGIVYEGNFAANPSGGASQGSAYAAQTIGDVTVDLGKFAGIRGGTLHFRMYGLGGRNLTSTNINNSIGVQAIYGPPTGETYRLGILTYNQKLFDGKLDFTVGRDSISWSAMFDPIYFNFESIAFSLYPPIAAKDVAFTGAHVPAWGGRVTINTTRNTHILAGVWDNNASQELPEHHGFDFSLDDSTGALGLLEVDYQTSFVDDAYPRRYDVGVVFDRTPYTYIVYNAATKSLGSDNAYGRSLPYVQVRQMVYRPDRSTNRGLTLFGEMSFGPSNNQPVQFSITGGASYQGPFAARPKDVFNVGIVDTQYRNSYLDAYYNYRVHVVGGTQRPSNSMVMGEVNYDAIVTPWLDAVPNFQYIVNPDGLGYNQRYPKKNLPSAFVVGLMFHVNIGVLLGFPTKS